MAGKQSFAKIFILIAALLLLGIVYFFAYARYPQIFPRCIFYSITGLYCPGCGSQRTLSALLHGNLWQALNYNVLFVACLPLLIYAAVVAVINSFRKNKMGQQLFYSSLFVKIFLAVVISFWIARNLPFYPFNLLAPHSVN